LLVINNKSEKRQDKTNEPSASGL